MFKIRLNPGVLRPWAIPAGAYDVGGVSAARRCVVVLRVGCEGQLAGCDVVMRMRPLIGACRGMSWLKT